MLTDTKQKSPAKSALKNPLLYSTVVLGIALLVVLWILFSRWQQNHSIERRAREENARKQMESDRTALEQLGGNNLAIQSFYASPGAIRKGESAQLCYGVANAKSVKLEPQPNEVWPSHARCVSVSLQKPTTYTLTISDAAGETQIQSLQVRVE